MNDDFLYDLRNNPPAEFATRLKAQLERQTVERQRKQRVFRWAAIAAMLVGSTAIAFVSPTVRQATVAVIVQLRGGEPAAPLDPELQRLIEQKDARASQRIMPDASFDQRQPPADMEWNAASGRAAPDAATFAPRPDSGGAVAPSAASGGTTVVGGARGRIQLRVAHAPSLAASAKRIAATLEDGNANLDVVATSLADCARDFAANQDVWIQDREVAGFNERCAGGRRFIKAPLAYDAIVLIVHRENSWAQTVSIDDLRKLRDRDTTDPLLVWSQLRPEWPTLPISLAGTSLRESEVGRRFAASVGLSANAQPSTFAPMKDDRATLKYVENTLGAIGYIDYATWEAVLRERSASPTIVAIADDKGEPIRPGVESIQQRRYPLSRPLWVYVEDVPLYRRTAMYRTIEQLRHVRTLEDSGLIPLGRDEQHEAAQLLRGY